MRFHKAFTLAELLIALAILGVIAIFTIPKVLNSQQNGRNNSIAKEAIGMLSGAYSAYQQSNPPGVNTGIKDLTPFLNYVKVDTTSTIDAVQTQGTLQCAVSGGQCLVLHNGARFIFWPQDVFGGTASTNAIQIQLDPDGTVTNGGDTSASAVGKSLGIFLYYNGRLKTYAECDPSTTYNNGAPQSPCAGGPWPALNPPWFSWN